MLAAAAAAATIAGCVTIPLDNLGANDNAAVQKKLNEEVPLYNSDKLAGDYLRVGSISASACDNGFIGGVGREAVVEKLQEEAESMGANGITDLNCGHAGTNEIHGCFSSTACSATALKIVDTGK